MSATTTAALLAAMASQPNDDLFVFFAPPCSEEDDEAVEACCFGFFESLAMMQLFYLPETRSTVDLPNEQNRFVFFTRCYRGHCCQLHRPYFAGKGVKYELDKQK
jgi:hypothetical protein